MEKYIHACVANKQVERNFTVLIELNMDIQIILCWKKKFVGIITRYIALLHVHRIKIINNPEN